MGEIMFEIDEIKYLCSMINETIYISPRSTYEFIMYGDIDHYEILVTFNMDEWLKKFMRITYKKHAKGYLVTFIDEQLEVYMESLEESIESYLQKAEFNIDAIAMKISMDAPGFCTYVIKNKTYYLSWIDVYNVRSNTKMGYIEPIHLESIAYHGDLIFKMVELKVKHQLDIEPYLIEQLSLVRYEPFGKVKQSFFNILSDAKSHQALEILDQIGVLERAFPLIKQMKDKDLWDFGLYCLKKLECVLNSDHYFQESLSKAIDRNMGFQFDCGLTKYQMIKFSVLFHDVYKIMKLKQNSPELYEDHFTDFCSYFEFKEKTCQYYAQVIQSHRKILIDLKESISVGNLSQVKLYEFYEEYQDEVLDVLLVLYVDQLCHALLDEEVMKERMSYVMKLYISKYCEIQSINSEITTMEIDNQQLSDIELTLLIEDVKKNVFFGNLRYDRNSIIKYFQKLIEQS